jgi:hypothetical protein
VAAIHRPEPTPSDLRQDPVAEETSV